MTREQIKYTVAFIADHTANDQKIEMIKRFRSITGFCLKESKDLVEAELQDRFPRRTNVDCVLDSQGVF